MLAYLALQAIKNDYFGFNFSTPRPLSTIPSAISSITKGEWFKPKTDISAISLSLIASLGVLPMWASVALTITAISLLVFPRVIDQVKLKMEAGSSHMLQEKLDSKTEENNALRQEVFEGKGRESALTLRLDQKIEENQALQKENNIAKEGMSDLRTTILELKKTVSSISKQQDAAILEKEKYKKEAAKTKLELAALQATNINLNQMVSEGDIEIASLKNENENLKSQNHSLDEREKETIKKFQEIEKSQLERIVRQKGTQEKIDALCIEFGDLYKEAKPSWKELMDNILNKQIPAIEEAESQYISGIKEDIQTLDLDDPNRFRLDGIVKVNKQRTSITSLMIKIITVILSEHERN